MQAQKIDPPDLTCKDKFLVQGTVVAVGTTEEDITSSMVSVLRSVLEVVCLLVWFRLFYSQFVRDSGKYVEGSKLRVVLARPPHSPALSPINGVHDQVPAYETSPLKDQVLQGNENIGSQLKVRDSSIVRKFCSCVFICEKLKAHWFFNSILSLLINCFLFVYFERDDNEGSCCLSPNNKAFWYVVQFALCL